MPIAVATAIIFAVVAILKPWVGPGPARVATDRAVQERAFASSAAPDSSGAPQPAGSFGNLAAGQGSGTSLPTLGGLDLSFMGTTDPHHAWGVAAAYVPLELIVSAGTTARPSVTPVVDWVTTALNGPARSPTIDYPGMVTVALAVTWPEGPPPVGVRLDYLGPVQPGAAAIEARTTNSRFPRAHAMSLAAPVPLLAGLAAPGPLDDPGLLAWVPWEFRSGTFFLPSGDLPKAASGWTGHGWAAGYYRFVVTARDGTVTTISFAL